MEIGVFSISKNHCYDKSDKKTESKYELTLAEHV